MLNLLLVALIFGLRTRYAAVLAVVVVLLVVAAVGFFRRGRRPGLDLRQLAPTDVERYQANFTALEAEFVNQPEQAAARARGLVEEVLRRRGFPDRIEPAQRIADLRRHDQKAARALEAANAGLGSGAGDTEKLRLAIQDYRTVLARLTGGTAASSS